MLERRDKGKVECRTGGMQDRWDAGLEVTGMEVCRKEGMQERRGAGKNGCRKGGIKEMRDANLVLKRH